MRSAMSRWKTRPVRSCAWFAPVASTFSTVVRSPVSICDASAAGKLLDDVARDGEDGPVVDLEDFGPGVEDVCLGAAGLGGAELGEGFDAVHPDETLVEDHGVGDDRAGHAVGLDDIGHAEQPGDAGDHAGPGLGELFENVGGAVDALLEGIGGFVDGALGYGDETNEV